MKFVFFGYDFMVPAVQHLIDEGHELAAIFSFEVDNVFNFNIEARNLAQRHNVPFILEPVDQKTLKPFVDQDIDIYLAAGYPKKIPDIAALHDAKIPPPYAVNVHPTYLPKGRGLMPVPRIIMHGLEDTAGITAHKMTQDFDAGDILIQEKINLSEQETVESYCAKVAMRAPDMLSRLFSNLPT